MVVADLLLNMKHAGGHGRAVPIDLVTAGSPIRRLIVRLLPHRLPNSNRNAPGTGRWPAASGAMVQCLSAAPLVGMRLVSGEACRDPERGILECPLVPNGNGRGAIRTIGRTVGSHDWSLNVSGAIL